MFELRLEPSAQQLQPFYGAPVCLLMKDGSQKIGRLTACRAGRIILNGTDDSSEDVTVSRKKASRRAKRPRTRKVTAAPARPVFHGTDDFEFAPFGLGPESANEIQPRESVPVDAVDSVLVL